MSIIPSFFLDSVVTLGVKEENPDTKEITFFTLGSGFTVFRKTNGDIGYCFIITNKHVIANRKVMYARFNHIHGGFEELELSLINRTGKDVLYRHPNPNIDIAAICINLDYFAKNDFVISHFILNDHSLTKNQMQSVGIAEGSFIYSLGFPMNLVDTIKTPICRMGCISRIQDLYLDNTRYTYIIDTQVFPGNSGGPVITRPELASIKGTPTHSRASLIGVVYAYIPYRETLISLQDHLPRNIVQENSGLALVHPVDCIIEIVDIAVKILSTPS